LFSGAVQNFSVLQSLKKTTNITLFLVENTIN